MDVQSYEQLEVRPRSSAAPPTSCWRTRTSSSPPTRAASCSSSCPPRSSLVITFTEPGLAKDSATGRTKPATLETGHEIQVPLFINQGEKVKVDTRDSSYMGRVKS